ncbi:transcription factor ces-2-like [Adelges cooleyi]|uniref:transcription factor ces-2-like n=1 Tax=Adelges cooleyi TaxID=133065 RepID=UPI00217FFEDA|nr:transcription factor ces-2-like [Adelges cooleyi]
MEGLVDEFLNMCANVEERDRQAPGIINLNNSTNDINMYRDEPFLDLFQLDSPTMLAPFITSQNVFTMEGNNCRTTDSEVKQDVSLNSEDFKQPISLRKNSTLRLDIGLQSIQSTSYGDELNTPEVVKTLTEQESNFNLLSYVFDEKKSDHLTEVPAAKNDTVMTSPPRCSRKRRSSNSSASIQTDDDDYSKHRRPNEDNSSDDKYRQLRDRNNEASRKSRATRKAKEDELNKNANEMEATNRRLTVKAEELEKMVINMRQALLQIMTKKK